MKSWLLLLVAWIAAIAATPAYAFAAAESKGDAGYFSYSQRDNKSPAQNNRCELRKELLSGWFGALRDLMPVHSVGRTKNKADCATADWLEAVRSIIAIGRDLMLSSVRVFA